MDYYSILGVSKTASETDLKKAYKKQSMKHHPDRGGDEAKFKEVNEAYTALKDPQKRQMYDQFGTTDPQQAGGFRSQHFNNGGFNGAFDINDLMGQFGFGARQQMRNRDITIGCRIDIKDVYTGKNVLATYRLNNGKEQTVDIKIPVGIRQGDKIRYQGMGQQDIDGIPPGDLYVIIEFIQDNVYEVHGVDLITSKRVSVLSLILGTTLKVTLPDGNSISLNIPEGTQPNTTMRIANKGLPNRGGPTGHVLVKVLGQVPTLLDKEDLKQIEYIDKKYS
jgi:curved DNA-binding protein